MGIVITDTLTAGEGNTHALFKDEELRGGFRVLNTLVEMYNIPENRKKEGMFVKCIEDSNVYFLEDSVWVKFDPNAYYAHDHDILEEVIIVETTEEYNDYINLDVEQREIFDSWYRFSHGNNNLFPSDPTELLEWSYDEITETISSNINSNTYIGFVSNNYYNNYTLETILDSNAIDDDCIGVVISFYKNPDTGKEYTLSLIVTRVAQTHLAVNNIFITFAIVYNYKQSDAKVVGNYFTETSGEYYGFWNTIGGIKIKIEKEGDIVKAYRSGTTGDFTLKDGVGEFIEVDLSTDNDLFKFQGKKQYGFSAYSQPEASFRDTVFSNNDNIIYNMVDNSVYEYNSSNGLWEVSIDKNFNDLSRRQLLLNPNTNKVFYIDDNGNLSKIVDNTTKESIGLGNVNNTSDLNKPTSTETQDKLNLKANLSDISNFETTAQLNTRDINNKNRSNHTGGQLASTIFDFETKVLEYEHTGFKKGGNAPTALVDDTSYFLNGIETTLTLPAINSSGERVKLISNTTTPVRIYPQTGNFMEGVLNGDYTIVNKGDVVIFYSDGGNNWYVKNVGKQIVTGWASYVDNAYTSGSPLTISSGITTPLSNNANSGVSTQLPSDASTFWNNTTNKLVGVNNGDKYDIEVRFKAKSSSSSDNFAININIGGPIGIISKKTCIFVKAANTEQDFAESLQYFTGSTFLSNGGDINITAGTGVLSIYDISFLITRTHKGI